MHSASRRVVVPSLDGKSLGIEFVPGLPGGVVEVISEDRRMARSSLDFEPADAQALAAWFERTAVADDWSVPDLELGCGLAFGALLAADPGGSPNDSANQLTLTIGFQLGDRDAMAADSGGQGLTGLSVPEIVPLANLLDPGGQLALSTSRLALTCAAAACRRTAQPPDAAASGLFRLGADVEDQSALIWELATPPAGSRLTGVVDWGCMESDSPVAVLRGWVFSHDCDSELEAATLAFRVGPGVVGLLTGVLPDGRHFALALVAATRFTEASAVARLGPEADIGAALLDEIAAVEALVPAVCGVGGEVMDEGSIRHYLIAAYRMTCPDTLDFIDVLRALLAEACGVGLDRVLIGQDQFSCAYPARVHVCCQDAPEDVFVAWHGSLGTGMGCLLPVRYPGMSDPLTGLRQTTATIAEEWRHRREWCLPSDRDWHLELFDVLGEGDRRQGMIRGLADPLYRHIPHELLTDLQVAVHGRGQSDQEPTASRPDDDRRRKPHRRKPA